MLNILLQCFGSWNNYEQNKVNDQKSASSSVIGFLDKTILRPNERYVPLQNMYNRLKLKFSHSGFLYIWLFHGQETQLRTEVKNKKRNFKKFPWSCNTFSALIQETLLSNFRDAVKPFYFLRSLGRQEQKEALPLGTRRDFCIGECWRRRGH